jgi:hypothetical protein
MQHHGAPSRLLDFTYSVYIAAYFALEYSQGESAIWAVKGKWAMQGSKQILLSNGFGDAETLDQPYHEEGDLIFNTTFRAEDPPPCVGVQTPFRLNERLRIQMGTFLVPARLDQSFEDNLMTMPGWDSNDNVVKLVLAEGMRSEALPVLFDMGISRRSLFPGLDGYAQSLAVYFPISSSDKWK